MFQCPLNSWKSQIISPNFVPRDEFDVTRFVAGLERIILKFRSINQLYLKAGKIEQGEQLSILGINGNPRFFVSLPRSALA